MKRLLVLSALACAAGLAAPAAAQKKAEEAPDARTLVYLGDEGPVVIRVRLRIDGVSHRQAHEAFLDETFAHLDADKDGKLSKKEATAAPPADVLRGLGLVGSAGPDLDADRDGVVTRREFGDYYRRNGLVPFRVAGGNARGDLNSVRVWGQGGRRPVAEELNRRLLALLDANEDGKLSKQELEAAPEALSKFDRDEDEMLTPAELTGRPAVGEEGEYARFVALHGGGVSAGSPHFSLLAEGRTDRAMAGHLLSRYAKDAKKLSAKSFGLAKLDRDDDGWIDEEELSRLGDVTPDVELLVRLGERGEKEAFVEVLKKGRSLRQLETTKEGVVATIQNARVALTGPEPRKRRLFSSVSLAPEIKAHFDETDADKNGYLDRREADKSQFFRDGFASMDRDGDGMLYFEEMRASLTQSAKLGQSAARSCVSLSVRDDGKGLFDYADADGDGRLSVRELRGMAKALLRLDSDGDGKLALAEVPRSFRGTFAFGAAAATRADLVALGYPDGSAPPAPRPQAKGPAWFAKMDRNRDGDVSRGEWLGTRQSFDEIDADKDGLIDPAEAEAYDRAKRAK